jgi:uncharacterized membrane protein YedE/YeeE
MQIVHRLSEFLIGLLFGLGLILAGMTDPSKVIGFLDLAGAWDPSLALVMGGAVLVGLLAFALARRRTGSVLGGALRWPALRQIDRRLVIGSLVFGAGWGLAGFCPGPAVVSVGTGHPLALLFTGAMLAGMVLHALLEGRLRAPCAPEGDRTD